MRSINAHDAGVRNREGGNREDKLYNKDRNMNVEILAPSPAAKRKSRVHIDHVMPGDVITTEQGFMRCVDFNVC